MDTVAKGIIVDWGADPPDEAVGVLVRSCGITLYEARQAFRWSIPAMLPLASGDGGEAVAELRRLGIPAVAAPMGFILTHDEYPEARSLNRETSPWSFADAFGAIYQPDPGSVVLLVAGLIRRTTTRERFERDAPASPITRAVAGVPGRNVTQESREERELVLAIVSTGFPEVLAIRESRFQPACLGSEMQSTRVANFARLWELVKSAYPNARVDERLLSAPLAEQTLSGHRFAGLSATRTSTEGNFWRVVRMVAVLALDERAGEN